MRDNCSRDCPRRGLSLLYRIRLDCKMRQKQIGIIGFGNMGSAIADKIKREYKVTVFDRDKNKTNNLSGIKVAKNIQELVKGSEVVILAVKPQDFDSVLQEIKDFTKGRLIISIAAGITTTYIEKILKEARVIRVMPNLPARVGKGMSTLCKGKSASNEDLEFVRRLFKKVGDTLIIGENMLDAATAVSGSGPAYVCYYLESAADMKKFLHNFQRAAEAIGFSETEAAILATGTYLGTFEFLKKTGLTPSELKKQVASKGGTTEAALKVLEAGGTLEEAVRAAKKRAEELSRKE